MNDPDALPVLPPDPKKILFVCTGNSCRSVMAEGILKKMLAESGFTIRVASAGTEALSGMKASPNTLRLLAEAGLDFTDHRTQKITRDLLEDSDLIFVMERKHLKTVLSKAPKTEGKVFLLSEFCEGPEKALCESGIPDPIGRDEFFYENVKELIRLSCQNVYSKLKEGLSAVHT